MNGFVIRAKLPSLNEYTRACRTHWAAGAEMKKSTQQVIALFIRTAARAGTLREPEYPVVVRFVWHERTRKRDPDNIFSAKKYILDALQKLGILAGDSQKYIVGIHDDLVHDTDDFVEVELIEKGQT